MRSVENLEENAEKFWPREIADIEKNSSVIPLLIESLDKFVNILKVSDSSPYAWKSVLNSTDGMPPKLFLKHLMVLADIGGEPMMRFKTNLDDIFTDSTMEFMWNGEAHTYSFTTLLQRKAWNNSNLLVGGEQLNNDELTGYNPEGEIIPVIEDACMLILFGGAARSEELPSKVEERCIIGQLLGKEDEIDDFVSERYIWVSRITGGATANKLGYIAEGYVKDMLKDELPKWNFDQSHIPGISQNDGRTPIRFDIVAESPGGNYCAIEVSFQVTTNSTIERKAGQAQSRYERLNDNGHKIAYIVDGAGNFERRNAVQTISNFSDIIVTFKDREIGKLIDFLRKIE